jgi:hypothetical protein
MNDSLDEIILLTQLKKGIAPNQYNKLNLRYLGLLRQEIETRIKENIGEYKIQIKK